MRKTGQPVAEAALANMPSDAEIAAARAALGKLDPALAFVHVATPVFAWRSKPSGFAGLVKLILEQQVSVASAAAIWLRLEQGLGTVAPASVLAQDVDGLKAFGLSTQKARYVRALAEADCDGRLDFAQLRTYDDAAAVAELTALKGVGRWTAEVYLMFCEGRSDLFPAGDLALQEALRLAEGAAQRLGEKALYARAELWRPHRGVAAHLLWAYFAEMKRTAKT
jgi:DNA-3-methyladenine glycosylase II